MQLELQVLLSVQWQRCLLEYGWEMFFGEVFDKRLEMHIAARRNEDGNVHKRVGISKTVTKNMWAGFFKNPKTKDLPNPPAGETGEAPFRDKNITAVSAERSFPDLIMKGISGFLSVFFLRFAPLTMKQAFRTAWLLAVPILILDTSVWALATFGRHVDTDNYLMKKYFKQLINHWKKPNLFGFMVQFFFEMVTKFVQHVPHNWTSTIFWLKSFFFYVRPRNLQSLVTQQNVPRTDEIHRHFFINGRLDSKKGSISCVGGVGKSKCKSKLNTFKYINNIVNLPLLLLAVAWSKAGKSVKKILADFLFCGGVLLLQKLVHPEGCVLLQWQDKGTDKKYDEIFSFLQLLDTEGLAFVFWRVFLISCNRICPLLLHTIIQ